MAVATIGQKSIREHAYRIWNSCIDEAGAIDTDTATTALVAFLATNLDVVNLEGIARAAIADVDRSLRPKHNPQQLSFFQPEAFIPYGSRLRVRMADATQDHLMSYKAILDENHRLQVLAHQEATTYIAARIAAWQPLDRALIDVERRAFGYAE